MGIALHRTGGEKIDQAAADEQKAKAPIPPTVEEEGCHDDADPSSIALSTQQRPEAEEDDEKGKKFERVNDSA